MKTYVKLGKKGFCLMILKMEDYIQKMSNFLNSDEFEVLPTDPLSKFFNKLKTTLGFDSIEFMKTSGTI